MKEDGVISKTAAEDWQHIAELFKASSAMRPSQAWFNGVSTRLDFKRVEKMQSTKRAKALKAYLGGLSNQRIKTLRTYAAINQEQTLAAFRVTLLGNVSVPILLLTFANQITDGGITAIFKRLHENDPMFFYALLGGTMGAVAAIALIAIYALANLNQARDVRHLLDLTAAERGIYFGLEDMDDVNLS